MQEKTLADLVKEICMSDKMKKECNKAITQGETVEFCHKHGVKVHPTCGKSVGLILGLAINGYYDESSKIIYC